MAEMATFFGVKIQKTNLAEGKLQLSGLSLIIDFFHFTNFVQFFSFFLIRPLKIGKTLYLGVF